MTCSVPQGSILGPLLFTVYINDLPDSLRHSKVSLYADDTANCFSDPDPNVIANTLNAELSNISNWFAHNKLSLNTTKCKFMIFCTKSQTDSCKDITIKHNGTILERLTSYKYLGIKLDPHLKFNDYIDYVRSKTIGKIRLLGQVSKFLDRATRLHLYKSLILPIFDYAYCIYDCLTQQDLYQLQKLQNCAMCNILQCPRLEHTVIMHSELNRLRLE